MPAYDYHCPSCGRNAEHHHPITEDPVIACECGTTMRRCIPLVALRFDKDWSTENNGRGRMINQIADRPGDPTAYCKSQREAIDKAKAKYPDAVVHTA